MTLQEIRQLEAWLCKKVGHRCEIQRMSRDIEYGIADAPLVFQAFCIEIDDPARVRFWNKHRRENQQFFDTPFEAVFEYVMRWVQWNS